MSGGVRQSRQWIVSSELGEEKRMIGELVRELRHWPLAGSRLDEIKTAVAEACLNAIEHGNRFDRTLDVTVTMLLRSESCTFTVCDKGGGCDIGQPAAAPLTASDKIGWEQPRGWGLQLMRHYADRVTAFRREGEFCIELEFAGSDAKEWGAE